MGRSLRLRYYGAFVLLLVAYAAFHFLFWAPRLSYGIEQTQKEAMVAALESMGRKIAVQARAGNHEALRAELRSMLELYPSISEIRFTHTNGRLYQEPDRKGERPSPGGLRTLSQQVLLQGTLYGNLELSVDHARHARVIEGHLGSLFAIQMLGLLVLFGVLSVFIERYLGHPLERLAGAARAISHAEYHAKIPRGLRGAPGQIAHALARMRETLSCQTHELGILARNDEACLARLREASRQLEALLEPAGEGLWEWDTEHDQLTLTPGAERLVMETPGASDPIARGPLLNAMLGMPERRPAWSLTTLLGAIRDEDRERLSQAMQACREGWQDELHVQVESVGGLPLRFLGMARRAGDGRVVRVLGVLANLGSIHVLARTLGEREGKDTAHAALTPPEAGR